MPDLELYFKPGQPAVLLNFHGEEVTPPELDAGWLDQEEVTLRVACHPSELFRGLDALECLQDLFARFTAHQGIKQVQLGITWKRSDGNGGQSSTSDTRHFYNIAVRMSKSNLAFRDPPSNELEAHVTLYRLGTSPSRGAKAGFWDFLTALKMLDTFPGLEGRWTSFLQFAVPADVADWDLPPLDHDLENATRAILDTARMEVLDRISNPERMRSRAPYAAKLWESWIDGDGIPLGLVWCVVAALQDKPAGFDGPGKPSKHDRFHAISRAAHGRGSL